MGRQKMKRVEEMKVLEDTLRESKIKLEEKEKYNAELLKKTKQDPRVDEIVKMLERGWNTSWAS